MGLSTELSTVLFQLVVLAVTVAAAVHAALSARRAASFDVTRDFDALAGAVGKLQQLARSAQMQRVRQGALASVEERPVGAAPQRLSHDQLRALARSRNGATQ